MRRCDFDFSTVVVGSGSFYSSPRAHVAAHLVRENLTPHIACGSGAEVVVMGAKNFSRANSRSRRASVAKRSHSDSGMVCWQTKGIRRARASFQKELCTKDSSRHSRQ